MSYFQKYRHQFKNVEGHTVTTIITDTFSQTVNPYNIAYTITDLGGGNQRVQFTFSDIPAGASAIRLERSTDGGATFIDVQTFGTSSPINYDVPTGDYLYLFVVEYTDPLTDDEVFVANDLNGVTEDMQPSGNPLKLAVNNGSRKKYGIAGLQEVIRFNSSADINLKRFIRGTYSDRRYQVTTYINDEDKVIFRGYLSMADSQDSFLPHPNETVLTAVDGLGLLKNIPLTNFLDEVPSGHFKLIQFIAWCLSKTGIQQNINVVMNIREETDGTIADEPSSHFYNRIYIDAKTFEAEKGELGNCYEVLEKILGRQCMLGQRHGEWWIKNMDEYDTQPDYVAVFDYTGTFVEMLAAATYEKEIGIDEDMWWSQERAIVNFNTPKKFIKTIYRYSYPKEVPCNVDLSRGDYIADIDATTKKYELDCWTLYENRPNVLSTNAEAFIKRVFNANGTETERYAVIGVASALIEQQLISDFIPVHEKDKIDLSFSVKHDGQIETAAGTVTGQYGQIRLYADDGTYYTLEGSLSGSTPAWVACTSGFNTNQKFLRIQFDGTEDDTEWRSVGIGDDCPPIPKDGKIQIVFCHQLKVDEFEMHISSIDFEYIPYINGSYQKFTGQSHKIIQSSDNTESLEEEVFISDSPKKLFKGALKTYNGSAYVLAGRFWNAAVYTSGVPSDDYYHPFGYIEAFNIWNQNRLLQNIFSGSVQGIQSDAVDGRGKPDIPTCFHTYFLRDVDEYSADRRFMLLEYEIDLKLCEISNGVLTEAHDTKRPKWYSDTYAFKYITE